MKIFWTKTTGVVIGWVKAHMLLTVVMVTSAAVIGCAVPVMVQMNHKNVTVRETQTGRKDTSESSEQSTVWGHEAENQKQDGQEDSDLGKKTESQQIDTEHSNIESTKESEVAGMVNTHKHVHKYTQATCTMPATCSCGKTDGHALGHDYQNGICNRCKVKDETLIWINGKGYSFEKEKHFTVEGILTTTDAEVGVCAVLAVYCKQGETWVPYGMTFSEEDDGLDGCTMDYSGNRLTDEWEAHIDGGGVLWTKDENIGYGYYQNVSGFAEENCNFTKGLTIIKVSCVLRKAGEYKIEITDGGRDEWKEVYYNELGKYSDMISVKIY